MRSYWLLPLLALFAAVPGSARTVTYIYYSPLGYAQPAATRFVVPRARTEQSPIAAYGPFRVIDASTVALVGPTDARSPAAFEAMLRDYPQIATMRFVECPGTYDDRANLALGRMIRAAGIAAEVPRGGSVRSGAVELVLAGTSLTIDDGAEFAVHAWRDAYGRTAYDYANSSPEHTKYLAYYREMGMSDAEAASFYAMTNSVPFEQPMWLSGAEMRGWTAHAGEIAPAAETWPRLAYLDLGLSLY